MEEAAALHNPTDCSSAGGILEFIDITQALNPHKLNSGATLPHTSSNRQLPYLSERSTPLSSTIVQWGPEGIFVCIFYKHTFVCLKFQSEFHFDETLQDTAPQNGRAPARQRFCRHTAVGSQSELRRNL